MTKITTTKLSRARVRQGNDKKRKYRVNRKTQRIVGYVAPLDRVKAQHPKLAQIFWLVSIGQILNWSKWLKRKLKKEKKRLKIK